MDTSNEIFKNVRVLKEYFLESFGKVNLNHPLWSECLELEEIKRMPIGHWGYYLFTKCGQNKHIRVRRVS